MNSTIKSTAGATILRAVLLGSRISGVAWIGSYVRLTESWPAREGTPLGAEGGGNVPRLGTP